MAAPQDMILEMVDQELEKSIDLLSFDRPVPDSYELEPLDEDNINVALQQIEDNYPNYRMPLNEVFHWLFACIREKKDE